MTRVYTSGRLAVGRTAKDVANAVLAPPLKAFVFPMAHINRLVTLGMLPPAIRSQYGFGWTPRDERAFHRWLRRLKAIRSVMPAPLALWPEARKAQRI